MTPRTIPMPSDSVRVTPPLMRALLALQRVERRDGRATTRVVAIELDRSVQATHRQLRRLRDLGLVAWEGGGTLRSLVAVRRLDAAFPG